MLTVLTQNLRIDVASDGVNDWNHRRPLMENLLRTYEADVIAFQEVFENQRRDLIAMLPGYLWHGRGREPARSGDRREPRGLRSQRHAVPRTARRGTARRHAADVVVRQPGRAVLRARQPRPLPRQLLRPNGGPPQRAR